MEKKLNHLMTFESYSAQNEEFNPFKKEDWKDVGSSIRRGTGILTSSEAVERGRSIVFRHPVRKKMYHLFLEGGVDDFGVEYQPDPVKAREYLKFWAMADPKANPVWSEEKKKFIDRSIIYAGIGATGSSGN